MPCGDFSLRGKIVAVTGAGSGINFSFVELIVSHGARAIIADIILTKEAEEFVTAHPDEAIFTKCDVTKRADLETIIQVSSKTFADVPDVYVAGAGVFEPAWSNWWDDTEDDRYAEVDININGALKFARIATRALLSSDKAGVILIVASLAGIVGSFGAPLYSATKFAVVGFVRAMGELDELENIKVVAVNPGIVKTPLWTNYPEKMKQFGYNEATAASPQMVAEAMVDLCTDGKYAGGTCLEVTKGGTRKLEVSYTLPPGTDIEEVDLEKIKKGRQSVPVALMAKERKSKTENS